MTALIAAILITTFTKSVWWWVAFGMILLLRMVGWALECFAGDDEEEEST
jgi:hypothetical protein